MALVSMSWLTEKLDVNARWPYISISSTSIFLRFSYFALLVMNFDRYLATSYPIFHRTSVTKGILLTLLALLIIVEITLNLMSVNDFVIRYQVHSVILCFFLIPPMLFINYKLFLVVSKSRKNKWICICWENAALVRCSPLLSARIFIHTLVGSDSNLFWATIVTGSYH
jgi:hypothetical protein